MSAICGACVRARHYRFIFTYRELCSQKFMDTKPLQIIKNLAELAATNLPNNPNLSSLHPCDHLLWAHEEREEVVGGSTSSPTRHKHEGGTVMITWQGSRGEQWGGSFFKKHSGGIQSEIIALVERSLSDSVFKTYFLLVSDYSLWSPIQIGKQTEGTVAPPNLW